MLMMKRIIRLLPYVIVFVLGCIIALLTSSWGFFVYDNKFNLFDLLYFIVSGGIALFITSRIDDALQRRRSQKDIILKKMEEVDVAIKGLDGFFTFENSKHKLPNAPFLREVKNIAMWAKRYEKSITTYYKRLDADSAYKKINTRKLVKACTNLNGENEDDILCIDDTWFYSEAKFVQIKKEIESLRSVCYDNMILLNNCAS